MLRVPTVDLGKCTGLLRPVETHPDTQLLPDPVRKRPRGLRNFVQLTFRLLIERVT